MAVKKRDSNDVSVGTVQGISGEVNIAGGDIYRGFTARQVSVLLKQIRSTFQPKKFDGRCPYMGLDVFEEDDAEFFFGREKLVADLVRRVRQSRTVFITGPSGSGKSSLVRAGLIHALRQGAIEALRSERWLYATIRPGRDPLEALALAFSRVGSPELGDYFRQHFDRDTILNECAESALSERKDQRLVLFIDQFEEVFTQVSKEKAKAFIDLLGRTATFDGGRVILLFAMRSDFIANCATYPKLNELLSQRFVQIGAMQSSELVSAIAQPALRVGLRIDPDLIAQIINDMQGEPGALPLMQFALKDLFDSQQTKGGLIALTLYDYNERGGIREALQRHADASFESLDQKEQELARSVFSGLVEIGRGTQDTRRTALFNELVPANAANADVEATVQRLEDARLITTEEKDGQERITLSHEILIDAWPWLKKLVKENRDVIATQNEIATDAKEWEQHKRDTSYLYTGARLSNAREQLQANRLVLAGLAQEFVAASRARQRRGQVALIAGLVTIAAALLSAVIIFRNQSSANAELAQKNAEIASTAQAASTLAFDNAATAQANADIALGRQLAAQSQSLSHDIGITTIESGLLAVEAARRWAGWAADQALRRYLSVTLLPLGRMNHGSSVFSVTFSPNGRYVASGGAGGIVKVWEAATGKEVASMIHTGAVTSIAFSPNGRYVASAGIGGIVIVWEAATSKELAHMTRAGWVHAVAFSPNGKYVVSGSEDQTACVWEAATGQEVACMTHDSSVTSAAFSPDGRYVVSGSNDHTARVWEAATGKEVARVSIDGSVLSVAFSPDGKYVVSGGLDNTARVWEAATGKEVAHMIHDDIVTSVAFSPDGRYVVSGSNDRTARVWEATSGKAVAHMTHLDWVRAVAFSPDGNDVVSGGVDGNARVWEAGSGKEVAHLTFDDSVTSVAFSPDGKYVAAGSLDGTARVWEVATGSMTHAGAVTSIAFSPDGRYVLSGSEDRTARVWEAASGKEVARMTHTGPVTSAAFSPDGKYVVTGSVDGTARVWEAATGKEVARMTHTGPVTSAAFSSDGRYVLSASADKTVRVWEAATGEEVARMTRDAYASGAAFSPDGKYVASGDLGGIVYIWEVSTGQKVASMTHAGAVNSIVFSPDGKYVVSASNDGIARVWEAATGQEVARMTHDGVVNSFAFSPDGRYIVSGSTDKTVRVWEATTGKELVRMTSDDSVTSVAFSPDGKYVVSGGWDKTARVWEAATGKEVARMTFDDFVSSVAFSPDGKYVASGSGDKTARVWYWQLDDLIAEACKRLPRNFTRAEWAQFVGSEPYRATCTNLLPEPAPTPTATPTATP